MTDQHHLSLLEQGSTTWNAWRERNQGIRPDLAGASLSGRHLAGVNLVDADLSRADLSWADLWQADLRNADLTAAQLVEVNLSEATLNEARLVEANLTEANLSTASLYSADLSNANLHQANLYASNLLGAYLTEAKLTEATLTSATLDSAIFTEADLSAAELSLAILVKANMTGAILKGALLREADLSEANLSEANLANADLSRATLTWVDFTNADLSSAKLVGSNLIHARFIGTNLESADLTGSRVYGISAWDLKLDRAKQVDLVITPPGSETTITVDDVDVAQFMYLLLNNKKLRDVIDSITTKVVLILGRFTADRKAVLDALREELRRHNYLPVMFDFDTPNHRDTEETVSALAHMARFVIADITEPRSIPQELSRIVPGLPSVPIQPLLQSGTSEYGMFEHFQRYPSVLGVYRYDDLEQILTEIEERIIGPAEIKVRELLERG